MLFFFPEISFQSHVNVGKTKLYKMKKQHFQRPFFVDCKLCNFVIIICNYKVAISAHHRKCNNLIYFQLTYRKQTKC